MSQTKVTRAIISHQDRVKMTQTLPSGRHVYAVYKKNPNKKWWAEYSTDSAYHICPYSGKFIDCKKCELYGPFDEEEQIKSCLTEVEYISTEEMTKRAYLCSIAEGCDLQYWSV